MPGVTTDACAISMPADDDSRTGSRNEKNASARGQRARLVREVAEVRGRDRIARPLFARVVAPDHHQPVRLRDRAVAATGRRGPPRRSPSSRRAPEPARRSSIRRRGDCAAVNGRPADRRPPRCRSAARRVGVSSPASAVARAAARGPRARAPGLPRAAHRRGRERRPRPSPTIRPRAPVRRARRSSPRSSARRSGRGSGPGRGRGCGGAARRTPAITKRLTITRSLRAGGGASRTRPGCARRRASARATSRPNGVSR